MTIIPNYGNAFALWRAGASSQNGKGGVWHDYTGHAFVKALGDGSLPRASFIHYLVQDYVYLIHYARAWALGVVKADTLDEMRACTTVVDSLVNLEMTLHVETCAKEGISEAQLFDAVEENENIAYTRYVLDAGLSGDFLDLMAAIAPCAFGYGEIGLNLKANAIEDNQYQDWIDVYSGDDYQQVCLNLGKMIDRAIERRIGENPQQSKRWPNLQKRYSKASALEAEFWAMGLRGGK